MAFSTFWSVGSNSFLLPIGLMSITMLDVSMLLGLFPLGIEVSAVMGKHAPVDEVDKWFKETYNNLSYSECINILKSTSRGMTDLDTIENVGFLLHFLYKFMFCSNIQKISREYINLTLYLAEGEQHVAMAPYMVGLLYKSLGHLVDEGIYDTIGGTGVTSSSMDLFIFSRAKTCRCTSI